MKGMVILLYEGGKLKLAEENCKTLVVRNYAEAVAWVKSQRHRNFSAKPVKLKGICESCGEA